MTPESMLIERTNWVLEDLHYNPALLRRVETVIRYYTRDGYRPINHAFLHNIRHDVQYTFLKYAYELAQHTPAEMTVYRGCGMTETAAILHAIENDIRVLDYEFPMSTSMFVEVATRFIDEITRWSAEYSTYVEYSALLAIRIPADTLIIYASALSACDDEHEFLLPPRVRLYIERIESQFYERDYSFRLTVHARAEVEPREVEEDYVDEDLLRNWAWKAGVNLDLDDEDPDEDLDDEDIDDENLDDDLEDDELVTESE